MPQATYAPDLQAGEFGRSDADLVALLLARDEAAITQLVDQWSPAMIRVARSFVGSQQSAEDVVQDAWLGMLSGLARFEGRSSLRTWIFSILVNRARTRGAREARALPRSPLDSQDALTAADWAADTAGDRGWAWSSIHPASRWDTAPESVLLSNEALRQLDRAMAELPPRQRMVVTMRDVCGMAADEVCEALNISPPNQRVLLHRARATLRAALAEYYRG